MAIESLDLAIERLVCPFMCITKLFTTSMSCEPSEKKVRSSSIRFWKFPPAPPCSSLPTAYHPKYARYPPTPLFAIDETCPLVTKVHLEAFKYAKGGYTIVLIGHDGHDEVLGTMGEAPEAISWSRIKPMWTSCSSTPDTKLAYLTQTTLSVDDATRIINRLRERFPWIESPPKEDICYATQNRQEAVRLLAASADICGRSGQPEQ